MNRAGIPLMIARLGTKKLFDVGKQAGMNAETAKRIAKQADKTGGRQLVNK